MIQDTFPIALLKRDKAMSTSRQFQKKASTQSAPTSLSTSMFDRPFPKRSATTEEPSTDTPDFQTRLDFARRHAPDLSRLAANSSRDRPSTIQTKLTNTSGAAKLFGQPNDQYEQEADRVADQVMSMPESAQPVQREAMPEEEDKLQPKPLAASITPLVQREEMPEDDQEVHAKAIDNSIQREEMPEEEEVQAKSLGSIQREEMPEGEEVQTKPALQRSSDGSLEAGGAIESRLNSSKGGGEPLADEVRSFMEPRFGADFSQVRVHTDGDAVQMNRELNAQAFAHKQDVYFGAGKAPGNDALTAHELTHVVQQTANEQIQRGPEKNPPPSEASQKISAIHGLWMWDMLQKLRALDKNLLEEMQKNVGTTPGINIGRTNVAIEAALGIKFSLPSANWLEANISVGGATDQVAEVRDFMTVDAFDKSASSLLINLTRKIQSSYKDAVTNNQTNTPDPTATNSPPPLPAEAEQSLAKLKILSPLAAIQLQAVINAQQFLYKANDKSHSDVMSATGLSADQEWCGGFVATNYIPLKLSALWQGMFWSTPKLEDFFNYKNNFNPYKWIQVDNQVMEVEEYHNRRGSRRKWLAGEQIHAGKELDIRPGDIVLQDNRGGIGADHIQMVQSWDTITNTLYTIDGNGGGYQVDNNLGKAANKNESGAKDEKLKNIEQATGHHLRPGGGGGVVGVGSYDLSKESTEEEVKKTREQGKKIVRIVAIGRPSLVDFESQKYSTQPPKK
ncbi:MAG: DUF4157 domain-containing protein [Phormidesmis sp. CAN_BIN36]|nr:DUF4157 domain-containing protein [Phormidesmis sp. CAN_BIN36]